MSLRINTNIAALLAHANLKKTDDALTKALERLSTGLRINKAADDASGMAIANVMRAQALGIGQAIRNANDGISIIQIADGALQESINIVDTIKTKAIQAAEDGQTLESRKAIQADIDKLMQELDNIAQTTSFNGMKLLSGTFTDKKFQIGPYTGETVSVSIDSAESQKIGHVVTGDLKLTNPTGGKVSLSIYSNLENKVITIPTIELKYNNSPKNGMGALADAINRVSGQTGVTAQAIVESKSVNPIQAGTTGSDFAINGVAIGAIKVLANDSDGSLVKAINAKTAETGVVATLDSSGHLILSSTDGRAIKVTGDTGGVLAGSDMSTFGYIKLYQTSANEIKITDNASGAALAIDKNLNFKGNVTTDIDMTMTAGSVVGSGSSFAAGTVIGFELKGSDLSGDITTDQDSLIKAGSVLSSSSTIAANTIVGGTASVYANTTTKTQSLLKAGSVLKSGTILKAGTLVTTDIQTTQGTIKAGTVLNADATLNADVTLQADMIALGGSTIAAGSTITSGSYLGANFDLGADMNVNNDMTLKKDSVIKATSSLDLLGGSKIGGSFSLGSTVSENVTQDMVVAAGSTLASTSSLATGSTLGGKFVVSNAVTTTAPMTLAAGSTLASGTVLTQGTVLTNDIQTTDGLLKAGTVLERNYTTKGENYLQYAMTIQKGSTIAVDSILAENNGGVSGTKIDNVARYSLADIDVTSQDSAQLAISIADAALKSLNAIRASLGSVQNQLQSTIANLSVTQVNVEASVSQIMDVDFAKESSIFSKMQVLEQAGTFALAQANASAKNVMRLLQG